jgi:anaerobic selenocysteine-containing dehydrogenase
MIGGLMSINIPRRKFLKAAGGGLLLPAAGRASTTGPKAAFQPPSNVVNLGQTGPKVCGVGCGIGFVPLTEEASRALDMGINYFDMSRHIGDSEEIAMGIINGRNRGYASYSIIYS